MRFKSLLVTLLAFPLGACSVVDNAVSTAVDTANALFGSGNKEAYYTPVIESDRQRSATQSVRSVQISDQPAAQPSRYETVIQE